MLLFRADMTQDSGAIAYLTLRRAVAIPMAERYVFRGPNRVAASHGSRPIQSSWSSTWR